MSIQKCPNVALLSKILVPKCVSTLKKNVNANAVHITYLKYVIFSHLIRYKSVKFLSYPVLTLVLIRDNIIFGFDVVDSIFLKKYSHSQNIFRDV